MTWVRTYFAGILSVILLLTASQCRKKDDVLLSSNIKLAFSTDSILFDTVFTTIGSTTKRFKIYNRNSGSLIISSIKLREGFNSQFRINVDGEKGPEIQDIEIGANDSLFVFVEVTVDPNNANSPLVIMDEIEFSTNGNEQKVVLEAWGQDAYFHVNEAICGDVTWPNDKPHVIYGIFAVGFPDICESASLSLLPGTLVHGHVNARFINYKSTLNAVGTANQKITFRGDRLEDYRLYNADSVAGQWGGLWFIQAKESTLENVVIRNAVIGIQVDTLEFNNYVNINKTIVENSAFAGILTQGGNVKIENSLFSNSGSHSGVFAIGGDVTVNHCTFANYWTENVRRTAAFVFQDFYTDNLDRPFYRPFSNATFTNCIMYGDNETEFVIDTLGRATTSLPPVFSFTNCLVKQEEPASNPSFLNGMIYNEEPNFVEPRNIWDFHLGDNSAAANKGNASFSTTLNDDLEGTPRDGNPDLGCYEK